MPKLTAEQRSMRGRKAALIRWSRENPKANAERGQQGLRDKFAREVAAEFPGLAEAEIERRAYARYRAHMIGIRFAASKRSGGEAA